MKPSVAFVGRLHGPILCACGKEMAVVAAQNPTYTCMNKMCERYKKVYAAIEMRGVLFYEIEGKK